MKKPPLMCSPGKPLLQALCLPIALHAPWAGIYPCNWNVEHSMSSFRWLRLCGRVSLQALWTLAQEIERGEPYRAQEGHFRLESDIQPAFQTLIKGRCVSIHTGNPDTHHILGQDSITEGSQGRNGSRDLGGGHSNWLTQSASITQDHLLRGGTARRELGSSTSVVNQENTPRDSAIGRSERWV